MTSYLLESAAGRPTSSSTGLLIQISRRKDVFSRRIVHVIRDDAYSVRHISYIRHTALSRTYAIVAYVRHNNNAARIVSAPDKAPVCMEPAHYSPISLIQNTWM